MIVLRLHALAHGPHAGDVAKTDWHVLIPALVSFAAKGDERTTSWMLSGHLTSLMTTHHPVSNLEHLVQEASNPLHLKLDFSLIFRTI